MIRRRPKRGNRPTKRLDLTDMRHLFRDGRVWSGLGVVIAPDGGPHWRIEPNGSGDPFDITVEVEIMPSQVHVTARLRAGMWEVPDVGDEVAILIPAGEIDFQPIVIATLSSGSVPAVQGPEPGRILIVKGEVLVHDGTGGAVALALKSDVDAQRSWVAAQFSGSNGHVHVVAGAATTTMITVADPAATPPTPSTPPASIGTTVLKAK